MKAAVFLVAIVVVLAVVDANRRRPRLRRPTHRNKPSKKVPKLECINYGTFRENSWICPINDKAIQLYDPIKINHQISKRNEGIPLTLSNCYDAKINNSVIPLDILSRPFKDPPIDQTMRQIVFEELCKMVKVDITNVFANVAGQRHQCVVVNTDWLPQEFHYAKCVNPDDSRTDKCQLDYATRNEYRCVASGFVEREIFVYCPGPREFTSIIEKVPTTCSCRKCAHCQTLSSIFSEFGKSLG